MLLESGESALLIFLPDEPLCIRRTSSGGREERSRLARCYIEQPSVCVCVSVRVKVTSEGCLYVVGGDRC